MKPPKFVMMKVNKSINLQEINLLELITLRQIIEKQLAILYRCAEILPGYEHLDNPERQERIEKYNNSPLHGKLRKIDERIQNYIDAIE